MVTLRNPFGRRGRKDAAFNAVPNWYWCPACGSKSIVPLGRVIWSWYRFQCGSCGTVFETTEDIDPDDYRFGADTGDDPRIRWDECPGPMDTVRGIATRLDPSIARIARDPEVYSWICDYWDYVRWNEHGNELSYWELAYDGGFASIVADIVSDPGVLIEYLLGGEDSEDDIDERSRGLIADLKRIHASVSP